MISDFPCDGKETCQGSFRSILRQARWRKLPAQVGFKTALVAEVTDLFESKERELRARSYRLISDGSATFACRRTSGNPLIAT
jgi:hypothetical protein